MRCPRRERSSRHTTSRGRDSPDDEVEQRRRFEEGTDGWIRGKQVNRRSDRIDAKNGVKGEQNHVVGWKILRREDLVTTIRREISGPRSDILEGTVTL